MAAPDPVRQTRELMVTIGREVALARANHGLTQRVAARLAGVAKSTVQRVEHGDPALRHGRELGRDGLGWVRPRDRSTGR